MTVRGVLWPEAEAFGAQNNEKPGGEGGTP